MMKLISSSIRLCMNIRKQIKGATTPFFCYYKSMFTNKGLYCIMKGRKMDELCTA